MRETRCSPACLHEVPQPIDCGREVILRLALRGAGPADTAVCNRTRLGLVRRGRYSRLCLRLGEDAMTRFRQFMAIATPVYFALAGLSARWLPNYPWISVILVVFGLHSLFTGLLREP